jgi:glycine/D-amino acid oxidase-like deaminating enzyme
MPRDPIFHPDFSPRPYWWEAYEPQALNPRDLPRTARVAVVGAGYAGLATALELAKQGIEAVVIDAAEPGFGASSRNAGFVGSYGNLSARYGGGRGPADPELERQRHGDALDSAALVERLIREEAIDCHWSLPGHLVAAYTRGQYVAMAAKVAHLNRFGWGAALLPPERFREELATDFYRGGMTIAQSGLIHPALYYRGLLAACERRGIAVCAKAPATKLVDLGGKWRVETARGTIEAGEVVIATNGYTGDVTPQFKRRLVPIGSYMIATEALPDGLVRSIIPNGRSTTDSRRVLSYCRASPDGRRFLFGGRVKFAISDPEDTARLLYPLMLERFPQLGGYRITHAWTGRLGFTFDEASHMGRMDGLHYALGCNGAGIAMMTYLGTQTARKIAKAANYRCSFDRPEFPTHPLYRGDPWFVPIVGQYFKLRDWLDRKRG